MTELRTQAEKVMDPVTAEETGKNAQIEESDETDTTSPAMDDNEQVISPRFFRRIF